MSAPSETNSALIIHSHQPFNAEPPLPRLRRAFFTPAELFYVRSHGTIPEVDATTYRLHIGGKVQRQLDLSLDDLRREFTPRSLPAVLQCAGNRRADMMSVRPVRGDLWAGGAIGNAVWTGVPLAAVLHAAGAAPEAGHVAFDALDLCEADGARFYYGVSIPMAKAQAPEVLLAFAMDGAPLKPEHGYPLRVVVPGYAGVRSAKWLAAITVQDAPSAGPMQARDYKLFPPNIDPDTADPEHGMVINDMPLNAAICEPVAHAALVPGVVTLRGWATASGRSVARVDVSANGGRDWIQATLDAPADAPWSWTFWEAKLDLPRGEHELAVRAWDSAGQTQPALPDDTWNFKGYLSASWHRVPVRVVG